MGAIRDVVAKFYEAFPDEGCACNFRSIDRITCKVSVACWHQRVSEDAGKPVGYPYFFNNGVSFTRFDDRFLLFLPALTVPVMWRAFQQK